MHWGQPSSIQYSNIATHGGQATSYNYSTHHYYYSSIKNRVGRQLQGYFRHSVTADGNCGYTAFGITRNEAVTQLLDNITTIGDIIHLPVEETLLTEEFYNYLRAQNAITVPHEKIIHNENVRNQYVKDLAVQIAYINFDVHDKRIDLGWAHPRILQALAHIRHIELHMWCLGENNVLVPHRLGEENYASYIPPQVDRDRVDLLFVNNNHFERLEFIGYENIPINGIYPLNFSWDHYKASGSKVRSSNSNLLQEKIEKRIIDYYKSDKECYIRIGIKKDSPKMHVNELYVNIAIVNAQTSNQTSDIITQKYPPIKNENLNDIEEGKIRKNYMLDKLPLWQEWFLKKPNHQETQKIKEIDPKDIFFEENKPIKQIVIFGRPGAGKSILCRYLAYNWATGKIWKEKFKWLFYFRLRDINNDTNIRKANSISKILSLTVFAKHNFSFKESDKFWSNLLKSNENILFILDGYDEVSEQHKTSACKTLLTVCEQYNCQNLHVLITSRPHVSFDAEISVDRVLEVIGFSEEKIYEYINKYYKNFEKKEKNIDNGKLLIDWIKLENNKVKQLCHTPLNLALFCDLWAGKDRHRIMYNDITQSELYYLMMIELLRINLYKALRPENKNILHWEEHHLLSHPCIALSLRVLQALAHHSLLEKKLIISSKLLKQVIAEKTDDSDILKIVVQCATLGFLTATSEEMTENDIFLTKDAIEKDYYFVHLSFQEFFVAYYFANNLVNIQIVNNKVSYEDGSKFITKYKYDPNYQHIWAYVAGIIIEISTDKAASLKNYFSLLLAPPKDLYGTYEAALLLRCCEEAKWLETPITQKLLNYFGESLMYSLSYDNLIEQYYGHQRVNTHNYLRELFIKNPTIISRIRFKAKEGFFNIFLDSSKSDFLVLALSTGVESFRFFSTYYSIWDTRKIFLIADIFFQIILATPPFLFSLPGILTIFYSVYFTNLFINTMTFLGISRSSWVKAKNIIFDLFISFPFDDNFIVNRFLFALSNESNHSLLEKRDYAIKRLFFEKIISPSEAIQENSREWRLLNHYIFSSINEFEEIDYTKNIYKFIKPTSVPGFPSCLLCADEIIAFIKNQYCLLNIDYLHMFSVQDHFLLYIYLNYIEWADKYDYPNQLDDFINKHLLSILIRYSLETKKIEIRNFYIHNLQHGLSLITNTTRLESYIITIIISVAFLKKFSDKKLPYLFSLIIPLIEKNESLKEELIQRLSHNPCHCLKTYFTASILYNSKTYFSDSLLEKMNQIITNSRALITLENMKKNEVLEKKLNNKSELNIKNQYIYNDDTKSKKYSICDTIHALKNSHNSNEIEKAVKEASRFLHFYQPEEMAASLILCLNREVVKLDMWDLGTACVFYIPLIIFCCLNFNLYLLQLLALSFFVDLILTTNNLLLCFSNDLAVTFKYRRFFSLVPRLFLICFYILLFVVSDLLPCISKMKRDYLFVMLEYIFSPYYPYNFTSTLRNISNIFCHEDVFLYFLKNYPNYHRFGLQELFIDILRRQLSKHNTAIFQINDNEFFWYQGEILRRFTCINPKILTRDVKVAAVIPRFSDYQHFFIPSDLILKKNNESRQADSIIQNFNIDDYWEEKNIASFPTVIKTDIDNPLSRTDKRHAPLQEGVAPFFSQKVSWHTKCVEESSIIEFFPEYFPERRRCSDICIDYLITKKRQTKI